MVLQRVHQLRLERRAAPGGAEGAVARGAARTARDHRWTYAPPVRTVVRDRYDGDWTSSNGWGYLRGKETGAWADWIKLWGDRPWIDAAPIPGINLGYNVMFHEYNLVRRVAGAGGK